MLDLHHDRALLERFRKGDPQVLQQLYYAYVKDVDTIVRQGLFTKTGARVMGPKQHADRLDLIQETFARAFADSARLAYDGMRNYRPYLLAICRNLLIDWARKQGREFADDNIQHLSQDNSNIDDTEANWAQPEVMKVVNRYIEELPPVLTKIHHQRYILEHSQENTAQQLGLSRQQVRTLEKKLKKGLRLALVKNKIRLKTR